jgi:hypothetical protein
MINNRPINVIISEDPISKDESTIQCPVCGFEYNRITNIEKIKGNDNYKAGWGGRGDLTVIKIRGECGHDWEICFGFHKGQILAFSRDIENLDYYEYIQSSVWKQKAESAKGMAGYRCQVCNKNKDEVVLNTHHRTYERLGNEKPEDLTVLCKECHSLYEISKRIPKPPKNYNKH